MNGYIAFVKKEFMENIKNYRFFILFAVFLTFGIASAFLAKFTPEILSALAADMEMNQNPLHWMRGNNFTKISPVLVSVHLLFYTEAVCQLNTPKGL